MGNPHKIRIRRWFDRHLHVRDGDMMANVLPCTLDQRATGAVIMPNLIPDPVTSVERAWAYRGRIQALLPPGSDFKPLMTCYLTDHTTPEEIERGFRDGAWGAAKLYMADKNGQGGTTGSAHGVRDLVGLYPVLRRMQEIGMPLLGHFEAVERDVDEFDRESDSLERDLKPLVAALPELKIVVEHITDGRMADFVADHPGPIWATVTAHHLLLNRNGLFDGGLTPVHWCKPVLKRETHRARVAAHATSGNPKFGAGTDSAPHPREKKEACCGCAAGVFTAPHAVELYTKAFADAGKLHVLERFLSVNGLEAYGLQPSSETMTIECSPRVIPKMVGGVHVFKGGEEIPFKLL